MKKILLITFGLLVVLIGLFFVYRLLFAPERINLIGRTIETTFGFDNGVVKVYSCGKLVAQFLKVEKLTTAKGTYEKATRPYRFGYGYVDANLNGILEKEEKKRGKSYFEIPIYADYIYYDAKFIPEEK